MTQFQRERLACAYFFAVPGLTYGIFTSRLPALKNLTQADDGQIGFLLLALGAASFLGLITSNRVIARLGARKLIGITAILFPLAMICASLAFNYMYLALFAMLGGLAGGYCEVAMNTQGIIIEKRFNRLCMSSLHACFSLGGALGSLSGFLFAALDMAPFYNFLIVCAAYTLFWPLAFAHIVDDKTFARIKKEGRTKTKLPFFIYFCGFMSMLCYVSEGSVGEWGSILLHSVKNAPQSQAALVFACFCTSMVIFRLLGDRLRQVFGDFRLVMFGAALGGVCMCVVLISSSIPLCLAAYGLMGVGFAPIVPILFSRAGKYPGIEAAKASSAMSVMSYTGLLVFPPFLGMLGDSIGLGNALWIIAGACFCVAAGSPVLLKNFKS